MLPQIWAFEFKPAIHKPEKQPLELSKDEPKR